MKKLIFTILAVTLAVSFAGRAQTPASSGTLVWCGLDYSKVKMIGTLDFTQPEQIFPGMLEEWNGLFMKEMEPSLEKMAKTAPVLSDLGAVEARNAKAGPSQIIREDGTYDEKVKPSDITDNDIAQIVSSYQLKHDKGVGLVFIMDRLVKAQAMGCLYVVFFDIQTRKVIHSERVVAKGGGIGFRNFWFSPVKAAVKQLPKMYKQIGG